MHASNPTLEAIVNRKGPIGRLTETPFAPLNSEVFMYCFHIFMTYGLCAVCALCFFAFLPNILLRNIHQQLGHLTASVARLNKNN